MDIVYMVREGNYNPELKYSLRSLINIPHKKVFIAGYIPEWTRNVFQIPVEQGKDRYHNTSRIIEATCHTTGVSDDFILMMDDVYILKPTEAQSLAGLHRGELQGGSDGEYQRQRQQAIELLKSNGLPTLNYDLHIPMIVNKDKMLKTLDFMKDRGHSHKRSVYGNMWIEPVKEMADVKIHGKDPINPEWSFLSSDKDAFHLGPLGKYLRENFKDKSPYEEE